MQLQGLTEENVTKRHSNGNCGLHFAAQYGYLDKIPKELLTEKNLSIQNNLGYTPLHLAAQNGSLNQVPYLILVKHKQSFLKNAIMTEDIERLKNTLEETKLIYKNELSQKIKETLIIKNEHRK
jgi:ankyrin repeat protein